MAGVYARLCLIGSKTPLNSDCNRFSEVRTLSANPPIVSGLPIALAVCSISRHGALEIPDRLAGLADCARELADLPGGSRRPADLASGPQVEHIEGPRADCFTHPAFVLRAVDIHYASSSEWIQHRGCGNPASGDGQTALDRKSLANVFRTGLELLSSLPGALFVGLADPRRKMRSNGLDVLFLGRRNHGPDTFGRAGNTIDESFENALIVFLRSLLRLDALQRAHSEQQPNSWLSGDSFASA